MAAIVANLTDATVGIFADHEEDLVPTLVLLEVGEVARAMQLWRQRAEVFSTTPRALLSRPAACAAPRPSTAALSPDGGFDAEGGSTRTVPPNLWAAVVLRDRHCRHPGCDRGPGWCEAHHVLAWADGGSTELANLVLGCTRHHHLWHRGGWHLKLLPDGELHVTTPEGRVLVSRPPP